METVIRVMREAAEAAEATVLHVASHKFQPNGLSCVLLLAESHLSIHTWPEEGYAAVDFYTCGKCDPLPAHLQLKNGLKATDAELMTIERGARTRPYGMRVVDHVLIEEQN